MTKPLTTGEKKERKEKRKQQKAASKTARTVIQPKPEETPPDPPEAAPATPALVNLCDDCAYEFGECEGTPKFAQDDDPISEGTDRVVECPAFVNVAEMPTADQATKEPTAPEPAAAEEDPGPIIVCSGGCGKTTEGMTRETMSGEFTEAVDPESMVNEWTCQDCLDKAAAEAEVEKFGAVVEDVIRQDLPERPDPKRFKAEEDFGNCGSCEGPLKRTALNRYQDAVRCTNGRCRAYRAIVKTVSTGVK